MTHEDLDRRPRSGNLAAVASALSAEAVALPRAADEVAADYAPVPSSRLPLFEVLLRSQETVLT